MTTNDLKDNYFSIVVSRKEILTRIHRTFFPNELTPHDLNEVMKEMILFLAKPYLDDTYPSTLSRLALHPGDYTYQPVPIEVRTNDVVKVPLSGQLLGINPSVIKDSLSYIKDIHDGVITKEDIEKMPNKTVEEQATQESMRRIYEEKDDFVKAAPAVSFDKLKTLLAEKGLPPYIGDLMPIDLQINVDVLEAAETL